MKGNHLTINVKEFFYNQAIDLIKFINYLPTLISLDLNRKSQILL